MTGIDGITWEMVLTVGILFVGVLLAAVYFGNYFFEMRRKNPELHVFNEARKGKRPPIIALVDPAGKVDFINGLKEKNTDIKLKEESYGLLIDPKSLTTLPKETLVDGTRLFFYGLPFYFPSSINGGRALVQAVKHIRRQYPMFNFIKDDLRLMELLTMSGDDIQQDLVTIMGTYPIEIPSEIIEENTKDYIYQTVFDLVKYVEKIKGQLKTWDIVPGYFSIHEGIQLLPLAAQSGDLKRLENNVRVGVMNDYFKGESKWMEVVKIFVICMSAIGIIYLVIKNV